MAVSATQTDNSSLVNALNGSGGTGKSAVGEAQDRFLKLLVTQLQNQDPMNPMENAELTTQLAQMSTVEGINNLNSSLSSLLEGYRSSQTLQAASLVGRKVLAAGDILTLQGAVAGGGADLSSAADQVKVRILDASGQVVRILDLGQQEEGIVRFGWDGKDTAGQQLSDGFYTIQVEASQAGESVLATALALDGVASVLLNDGAMEIDLIAQGQVNFGQVRQIY